MQKINLSYSHANTIATITLNDSKGNVLDAVMMNDLHSCITEFKQKNDLKLIVIKGEGKHFSFGASVEEHTKEKASAMLTSFHQLFYGLSHLHIPILAQITGQCLGGGMELALICHIIFADRSARFGQPEIFLGVFPPPASLILPLKLGASRAEEMLITGRTLTAEEAHQIGLVHQIFDDKEALVTGTQTYIEKYIEGKSASTLRFAVKAARTHFNRVLLRELPKLETLYLNELMETADANEGIAAFIEKRKPQWENR